MPQHTNLYYQLASCLWLLFSTASSSFQFQPLVSSRGIGRLTKSLKAGADRRVLKHRRKLKPKDDASLENISLSGGGLEIQPIIVSDILADNLPPTLVVDAAAEQEEKTQENTPPLLGPTALNKKVKQLGIVYLMTGFILGVVVIGMEINLVDFARLCNAPTEQATLALLWRSAGSMVGAAMAGPMMELFEPHFLAFSLLSLIGGLLYTIPFIYKLAILNSSFFGFGLIVSIVNTAVLLLLRQTFRDRAGVWLQGLSVTYQFGVIAVPALSKHTSLSKQYSVLAAISGLIMAAGLSTPRPSLPEPTLCPPKLAPPKGKEPRLRRNDLLAAGANFCLVGVIVNAMTYLRSYMAETGLAAVLDPKDCLLMTTVAVLGGQLVNMFTQRRGLSVRASFNLLRGFSLAAAAAVGSVAAVGRASPRHFLACAVGLFGLCWGPLIGYMYDIWNRTTPASAFGTAFVTFGGAVSCGLFPFMTFSLWKKFNNPNVLLLANVVGFVLSLFCVGISNLKPLEKTLSEIRSDIKPDIDSTDEQ